MKEQIRKCKYCSNEAAVNIGIHNWKNLFRKPTIEDYTMLFIIIMIIFSAYQYNVDIKNLTEYYEDKYYHLNQIYSMNQEPDIPRLIYEANLSIGSLDESNE